MKGIKKAKAFFILPRKKWNFFPGGGNKISPPV
jgi:hypothetical protein